MEWEIQSVPGLGLTCCTQDVSQWVWGLASPLFLQGLGTTMPCLGEETGLL